MECLSYQIKVSVILWDECNSCPSHISELAVGGKGIRANFILSIIVTMTSSKCASWFKTIMIRARKIKKNWTE